MYLLATPCPIPLTNLYREDILNIPVYEAYKVAGMRQEFLVTKFDYDENIGDYYLQGYRRHQQDQEEETH